MQVRIKEERIECFKLLARLLYYLKSGDAWDDTHDSDTDGDCRSLRSLRNRALTAKRRRLKICWCRLLLRFCGYHYSWREGFQLEILFRFWWHSNYIPYFGTCRSLVS